MIIELEQITKKIKRDLILDHISLRMESPKIIGFRGINGSGKTMLMRTILGFILPTDGYVRIDGKILGKDIEFPPSAGMLIENPSFLDAYSGRKNLELLKAMEETQNCNPPKEINVTKLLERVGLDPTDKRKYKKYSLGMKQRLGIAAALMGEPDLLVLDEPTNALDDQGVTMLKQIVREEKARGALILLSCHDKQILESLADEIYHIEAGKII